MATAEIVKKEPASESLQLVQPTPLSLIETAIQKGADINTIERLVALQEKMLMRDAEIQFNEALNRVQLKIRRVAPDLDNNQTRSKYASYAAIDRVIRPIYTEEGLSLSFTEEDCPKPEHVRIICLVSRGAYTRTYRKDMPADGKGAKGGDVMTKTHAAAAADSYAKRYLVKDIFNIAIGEDDDDGNCGTNGELQERLEWIANACDTEELKRLFKDAFIQFQGNHQAQSLLVRAKDARKKELQ